MNTRRSMLILSFSPITDDARVLKQVAHFSQQFDVTTCGFGDAPAGAVEHLRVPEGLRTDDLDGRLITLKLYGRAYWKLSAIAWARRALAGRRFDVAIADDVEAVPIAVEVKPTCGVLADLHEYTPRLHDDNPAWLRRITPFWEWVTRRYVTKARSWSTVSRGLAAEYEKNFGFRAELVTNAAPYAELAPTPVSRPLRLVHSGAALRNRHLATMAEAVIAAESDVTLDFYLTPNHADVIDELQRLAQRSPRIRVNAPVPYRDLVRTLNGFDVGVFVLEPVTFNYAHALPNKLFDYVQARLGILVGPSPEMADYVRRFEVGVVAEGFTVEATRRAVDGLSPEVVTEFKANADRRAAELDGSKQVLIWDGMIRRQLEETRA